MNALTKTPNKKRGRIFFLIPVKLRSCSGHLSFCCFHPSNYPEPMRKQAGERPKEWAYAHAQYSLPIICLMHFVRYFSAWWSEPKKKEAASIIDQRANSSVGTARQRKNASILRYSSCSFQWISADVFVSHSINENQSFVLCAPLIIDLENWKRWTSNGKFLQRHWKITNW